MMSKTIIITGASGNIGTATVKKMLDNNYRVIAVSNSNDTLRFAEGNKNFEFKSVNLTKEDDANSFVEDTINRYETIDAGLLLVGGFAKGGMSATMGEQLKKMYTLNFETAYYVARPLFQHMLNKGYGRIALIGARPALVPAHGKGMVAYALSKSLLFKLAELMNEESKGKNVITSVLVPSTIDTPDNRQSMPNANPQNWVTADQIADILEFICSEKSSPLREPVYKVYNNS